MANKTQPTQMSVDAFLAQVAPERRRDEAERVVALFTRVTGEEPVMWGPSIVGWGSYRYTYRTGRTGEWMRVGFSPRKAQLTFYGLRDTPAADPLLTALGPHTTGVGCVYVKHLADVDLDVLADLAELGYSRGDYDASRD